MESEVLNLENNGHCLFCNVPPPKTSPANKIKWKLHSVRTLLQYLQMNRVELETKVEPEGKQAAQSMTVDLEGSEVNAALCEGCGSLLKKFLELKEEMEATMESFLVSIQTMMRAGSERNNGVEYPVREGVIMKKALEILKMTQPRICSQKFQISEMPSAPAKESVEIVTIEDSEDEAEPTIQDSDSVPVIPKIVKLKRSMPPKGEADERNKRRRKIPAKLSKASGQKRAIGVGRKNARQVTKAPVFDKQVALSEKNEDDQRRTTIPDSDSVSIIAGISKNDNATVECGAGQVTKAAKDSACNTRVVRIETKDGLRYQVQEGIVLKEAKIVLQRLPNEVVKIKENKADAVETTIQDSDSAPTISKFAEIESSVPSHKYHDKEGASNGKNKRRRNMLATLAKARGQVRQRAIGKGQRKDVRQFRKASAHKRVVRSEENEKDQAGTTIQDSDSIPVVAENSKKDTSVSVQAEEKHPSNVDKFQCSKCGKKLSTNDSLKKHLLIHSGIRPWCCNICGKAFARKPSLHSHLLCHSKPFTCDVCQKSHSTPGGLKVHKMIHTGELPFKCSYCSKCFRTNSSLKVHLRVHTKEKPHSCSFCGKRFKRKRYLEDHIRTHTLERPFKCPQCFKAFSIRSNLRKHVRRLHEQEKNHACIFCNKTFCTNLELSLHLRVHVNENPYFCSMCDSEFRTKEQLDKHVKTKHTSSNN